MAEDEPSRRKSDYASSHLNGSSWNRLPSTQYPGARFSIALYRHIAQLPNCEFTSLRRRILAAQMASPSGLRLKRSFYSSGALEVPSCLLSSSAHDACAQHDFRYLVGPNVFKGDAKAAREDRFAADVQLGMNIGTQSLGIGWLDEVQIWVKYRASQLAGPSGYRETPSGGAAFTQLRQIMSVE
ncbi:hypothetical protein RB200_05125 [Streptomyces sp. PmtG]